MKTVRVAVCCAFVLSGCVLFAQDETEPVAFTPIGTDAVLVSPELLAAVPAEIRGFFTWPSEEEIADRLTAGPTVDTAIGGASRWVQMTLAEQWVPEDLGNRLIPLQADIARRDVECDAIRVRYEVRGYRLQVVQTRFAIAFVIAPAEDTADDLGTLETHQQLVETTITEFFHCSENILNISMGAVTTANGITSCGPDLSLSSGQFWHGLGAWRTDGRTVLFVFIKANARGRFPTVIPDWF